MDDLVDVIFAMVIFGLDYLLVCYKKHKDVIFVMVIFGPLIIVIIESILSKIKDMIWKIQFASYNKKKEKAIKILDEKLRIGSLDKNYIESFDDDKTYIYDNDLNIKIAEPEVLWFDNNEKEEAVSKIIDELYGYLATTADNEVRISDDITSFTPESNIENVKKLSAKYDNYINYCYRRKNEFIDLINKRIKYYDFQYKSAKVGREGEELVSNYLKLFGNFYSLQGIRLEVEDEYGQVQSIESDNIIISKYGVFVLEVKNFSALGNYNITVERDGRWLKTYPNGNVEVMKNATDQNNRHIIYLNKVINEALDRDIENYIEADGIIVIANDKISITNESFNQNIFRISELYSYIKKQDVVLTKDEMDKIRELLISRNLPPQKFPIYDYRNELRINYDKFISFRNVAEQKINLINEVANEYAK